MNIWIFVFIFFGKTLLLTTPSNVLLLHLKPTFLPIIWIFTEGDGIESRISIFLNHSYIIFEGLKFATFGTADFFFNFGIYEIELPVRKPYWEFHTNLTTIRDRSSSIAIRNSSTLWITGGEDLWSSELVGLDKTVQSGPNIPSKALY